MWNHPPALCWKKNVISSDCKCLSQGSDSHAILGTPHLIPQPQLEKATLASSCASRAPTSGKPSLLRWASEGERKARYGQDEATPGSWVIWRSGKQILQSCLIKKKTSQGNLAHRHSLKKCVFFFFPQHTQHANCLRLACIVQTQLYSKKRAFCLSQLSHAWDVCQNLPQKQPSLLCEYTNHGKRSRSKSNEHFNLLRCSRIWHSTTHQEAKTLQYSSKSPKGLWDAHGKWFVENWYQIYQLLKNFNGCKKSWESLKPAFQVTCKIISTNLPTVPLPSAPEPWVTRTLIWWSRPL